MTNRYLDKVAKAIPGLSTDGLKKTAGIMDAVRSAVAKAPAVAGKAVKATKQYMGEAAQDYGRLKTNLKNIKDLNRVGGVGHVAKVFAQNKAVQIGAGAVTGTGLAAKILSKKQNSDK